MKVIALCTLALAALAVQSIQAGEVSGFCRVRQSGDGRWWIVGPDGRDIFLRGIDHANWNGHFCEALGVNPYREEMKKRFASRAEWETQTLDRLNAWGFNALGAGCSPELRRRGLFHTEFLGVGQNFCAKGGEYAISKFEGVCRLPAVMKDHSSLSRYSRRTCPLTAENIDFKAISRLVING